MNDQETLAIPKRTYKKKETVLNANIARDKLQKAQMENDKAMWTELLSNKFDIEKCFIYFARADDIRNLRDYIALNKCPL